MFSILGRKFVSVAIISAIFLLPIEAGARVLPAGFFDSEKSEGNAISTGTLDFSLESAEDFSGAVTASQPAKRGIEVKNVGSLGFQYKIKTDNFSGDLCDKLKLKVRFEGGSELCDKDIKNFSCEVGEFSDPEKLEFEASLKGGTSGWESKECDFDLVFEGWQEDFTNFGDGGFSDTEKVTNEVESENGGTKNLVINEFYYDDSSSHDTGKEWIEIYNGTNNPIDLSGYELNATSGDYFVFPDSFLIGSKKFVVVHWRTDGTNSLTDLFTGTSGYTENMGNSEGWIALFKNSSHTSSSILDYVEYGKGGQTWESTAVSAGIWTVGDFVSDVTEDHSLSRKTAGYDSDAPSDFEELSSPTPGS